jgi:hypothetical protein
MKGRKCGWESTMGVHADVAAIFHLLRWARARASEMLRIFTPVITGGEWKGEQLVGEVKSVYAGSFLASVAHKMFWRAEISDAPYPGAPEVETPLMLDRFLCRGTLAEHCSVVSTRERPYARFYLWTCADGGEVPAVYMPHGTNECGILMDGRAFRLTEKLEPRLDELLKEGEKMHPEEGSLLKAQLSRDATAWLQRGVQIIKFSKSNVCFDNHGIARFLDASVAAEWVGIDTEEARAASAATPIALGAFVETVAVTSPTTASKFTFLTKWRPSVYPGFAQVEVGSYSYHACQHILSEECVRAHGKYAITGDGPLPPGPRAPCAVYCGALECCGCA